MKYYFNIQLGNTPFEDAVDMVMNGLKEEGFGIITDIDMQATLKKKIDVDFKKYTILGACNPGLAHQALLSEEEIGLLLPCNVIVYEKDDKTAVSVFNPGLMSEVVNNKELKPVADEVQEKLKRVLNNI